MPVEKKKSAARRRKELAQRKARFWFVLILMVSIIGAWNVASYWQRVVDENKTEREIKGDSENIIQIEESPKAPEPAEEKGYQEVTEEDKTQQEEEKNQEGETPAAKEETKADLQETPKDAEQTLEDNKENCPEKGEEQKQTTPHRILNSEALVPESAQKVGNDYFDDAAFVGDSITEGIKLYDIMSNTTVIAAKGINLDTVFTDDKIRTKEGNKTVLEALKDTDPKKIYLMFGANGVGWFTEEEFVKSYTKLVQAVKEQHPDSQIFLQSILPVTKKFEDSRKDISNEKIDNYNELIVKIAEQEKVWYLDVASCFKDENGYLPADSNGDGMHFGNVYYQKWFDYLKTHTIQEQSPEETEEPKGQEPQLPGEKKPELPKTETKPQEEKPKEKRPLFSSRRPA